MCASSAHGDFQWRESETVPITGVSNPYNLSINEQRAATRAGRLHALHWPVTVTGSLIPIVPFEFMMGWLQTQLGLHINTSLSQYAELLKTDEVRYFADTPIRDVGTDSQRRRGMASLTQLNGLRVSQENGVLIREQNGYVPPPLVGIWARFPYLHNNSVPNLCELLKPAPSRVPVYYSGEVENFRHYDFMCGGYPVRAKTPSNWRAREEHRFDTSLPGLSNRGHDFGFSSKDRRDLIQFLLTL